MKKRIESVLSHYGLASLIIDMDSLLNSICREIEEEFNLEHLQLNDEKRSTTKMVK